MATQLRDRLHGKMHEIPGMPPHSEAARLNANPHARRGPNGERFADRSVERLADRRSPAENRHHSPANRTARHTRPPRVLVSWQEWIGGLFGPRRP
jgi:hypothetical protein